MHIADGIKYIRDITNSETQSTSSNNADGGGTCPDILILDVDSADSRYALSRTSQCYIYIDFLNKITLILLFLSCLVSVCSGGLTCPASEFVEETFLLSVKRALPQHGLFVVNLVSRSQSVKDMVVSRMKKVKAKCDSFLVKSATITYFH